MTEENKEEQTAPTESGNRVITLSLAEQHGRKLSNHFLVDEFACNDKSDTVVVDLELVDRLEIIREYFASPVIILSGYRTPSYNEAIGGAKFSQHMEGKAADIVVVGVKPEVVATFCERTFATGGVGRYKTFTHIDTRPNRARW